MCHNLRRYHGVHTKALENPTETLSMYYHVKIKLMYVVDEKYVLFQEPIGHLHKIITINKEYRTYVGDSMISWIAHVKDSDVMLFKLI